MCIGCWRDNAASLDPGFNLRRKATRVADDKVPKEDGAIVAQQHLRRLW
jgi:hypothetical protein